MLRKWFISLLFVILAVGLVACAQATPAPAEPAAPAAPAAPAEPAASAAAFKVSGMVNAEQALSADQLKGMETMQVDSTGKDGTTTTYTGVGVAKLLELAGVKDGATTVAFVADDGYSAELPLADVQACADCIVGFRDDGRFQLVMPGFPGNAQVKGVVEILVK